MEFDNVSVPAKVKRLVFLYYQDKTHNIKIKTYFLFEYSEKSIPTMALTSGFWLGATYLDSDYIFDGNLGKVNKFNLTASNSVSYFSQVIILIYFWFGYFNFHKEYISLTLITFHRKMHQQTPQMDRNVCSPHLIFKQIS